MSHDEPAIDILVIAYYACDVFYCLPHFLDPKDQKLRFFGFFTLFFKPEFNYAHLIACTYLPTCSFSNFEGSKLRLCS